jgi:hypothetical protein
MRTQTENMMKMVKGMRNKSIIYEIRGNCLITACEVNKCVENEPLRTIPATVAYEQTVIDS